MEREDGIREREREGRRESEREREGEKRELGVGGYETLQRRQEGGGED